MVYGSKPTASEWQKIQPGVYRHVTGRRVEASQRADGFKWTVVGGRYDGFLFGKREHAMLGAEDKGTEFKRVRTIR